MSLIGFNLKSIKVINEEKQAKDEISINSTPTIKGVEKRDIDVVKDVLAIQFEFKTLYEPKMGEISFEGEILYKTDDTKKILKTWKDEKKLDDSIALEVLNTIFKRCLTKSCVFAEDVRLPPPIQFPIVRKKEEE